MFNGVSQQAPTLRHPSQSEEQINAYSTISLGLLKRPPTKHLAKLTSASHSNSYFHTINRDSTERYKVILGNGILKVYDLTGAEKTVAMPFGGTYLACTDPKTQLVAVTVSDFTFIVNKTVSVGMTADVTPGSVTGTVQEFTDLPAPTGTSLVYEVAGSPSNRFDNYYVVDTGVWTETKAPGTQYRFNAATMPHKLVREADGTFTFTRITWEDRLVGDDSSNPLPSFVGRKINDVFFYRDRLGFISDEGFQLSRTSKYFNYWITTVTASLDSDPIDAEVSNNKVSILNFAVVFNKVLMLFSDQTQFQVTSAGSPALTQKAKSADSVTDFASSKVCRPLAINTSLFFVTDLSSFSGVREYFVDVDAVANDAADITAHVPSYLPAGITAMSACNVADALFLHSRTNRVYIYKFYWGDKEKLQSSWSYFELASDCAVLDFSFIGTTAYLCLQRLDGVYLESMDLSSGLADPGFSHVVLLDRRCELTGVYNSSLDETVWTLPFPDDGPLKVVLGASFGALKGSVPTVRRDSSTTVTAKGNYSAGVSYVGKDYTMRYRLSTIHPRDDKGAALQDMRLQLQYAFLTYQNSGYFRVEVTPKARETYAYPFTGKVLGDSSLVLGTSPILSGSFKFPIQARNTDVTIDIINDTHLPCAFQSIEWAGEMVPQSQRI